MQTQLELRSAARDGRGQADSEEDGVLRSPTRRPGPSRTPTRPTPRPLPPPGPEEDDELLRAITARLRPNVPPGVLPEVVAPEPELPPTPEHPDPVVSTPPSGIHNTPSRRPRRNRALAERLKSSSPLKQPPLRPSEPPVQGALAFGLPAKKALVQAPAPAKPGSTNAELRGLKPVDPDLDKKKLRDSLLAEMRQLERDLEVASKENERIRQARLSRHSPSPPANADEIIDLLTRHILPPETTAPKPDPIESWLASALNPIAFLPFSKPSATGPPTLPPPQTQPPDTTTNDDNNLPPPVSHHPLPMTTAEALPFLQVFTPLTFTAHVSPLPRDPDTTTATSTSTNDDPTPPSVSGPPLLQQHSITASSTSPRGLFAARIEMTVHTKTMAVAALAVPALDPAAEAELRPFVERVTGGGGGQGKGKGKGGDDGHGDGRGRGDGRGDEHGDGPRSSGLYHNVAVLGWAMGEWLRVARQRAGVWMVLEREVGSGEEALAGMVGRWRARGRERRRRGGRRKKRGRWEEEEEREGEEGEGGSEDGSSEGGSGGKGWGVADLLPFMGRTAMDLEVPVLEGGKREVSMLRVQWRIAFDWTGEARSEIGVLVGVPGKCEFCPVSDLFVGCWEC